MPYPDADLSPATAVHPSRGSMPPGALTYEQLISLIAKSLVDMGYAGSGGAVDPVPLIEEHRIDTTNVHGVANTSQLVLTGDSRLSNARTPVAHSHPESDVTSLVTDLASKASSVHDHDSRYYTEAEVDALLASASGIPAALNWQAYPLSNGWRSYPAATGDTSYGAPQYARHGAIVFLRGVLDGQTSTGGLAALPLDCRPPNKQRMHFDGPGGQFSADMNANGVILTPIGGTMVGTSFIVLSGFYDVTP